MDVLPPSLAYILTLQRGLWENQTSLIFTNSLPVLSLLVKMAFLDICKSFLLVVKLQFPCELRFIYVIWITSKSNQKYMLDVVNEVFSRSGRTKTRPTEASRLLNSFILGQACLYIWYQNTRSTGSPNNDQIR